MQRLSVFGPFVRSSNWLYRQDVGLYPARHVCNSGYDAPPPLPIIDLSNLGPSLHHPGTSHDHGHDTDHVSNSTAENVERAKVVVGRGWDLVRSMNWRDMTKKEPESNGSRMWGRLLQATSTARQKVADKYYDIREGGNGASVILLHFSYRS